MIFKLTDSLISSRTAITTADETEIEGSFLDAAEQLIGDTRVFEPHDALFRTAKAQEVDASVSNDFLIEYRKFPVDAGFEHHLDAGGDQ